MLSEECRETGANIRVVSMGLHYKLAFEVSEKVLITMIFIAPTF